jgi:hypothetical protein
MVLSVIKVSSLFNISFICPLDRQSGYFFLWICTAECFLEMKNISDADFEMWVGLPNLILRRNCF